MPEEIKSSKVFYGWFVVAACFAVTLSLGETFWSFGVFFKPMENEFGWSRTVTSSGYTAFLIGYAVSVITTGRLADRYSPRPILLATAILAGLGISLCSQAQSINQLRLFLLIGGLGAGATLSVPTSVVQRWFYGRKRAGLALGIVVSGVGVGALIFAPLINYFIISYGWRIAYLIVGIIFFVIITISSFVIRQSPVDVKTVVGEEGAIPIQVNSQGWTTSKVATAPSFIGMVFIMCVAVVAFQAISVHFVPHATDAGISSTVSAAALGLWGGFSVPGRILSGLISDRIGWQKTLALSLFGMALAVLWLVFLEAPWMLYCFVFFYGFCHGARVPAQFGIISVFFGTRSLGELIGITLAVAQLTGAFAPYMAGFVFDTTGSYFIAFMIIMALLITGCLVAITMRKPPVIPK
ncbi:MFS transporter [Chloroflexota bacterium]